MNIIRPRLLRTVRPSFSPIRVFLAPLSSTSLVRTPPLEFDVMGKKDGGGKGAYQLKVPKGTKDWDGADMVIREKIFSTITQVFKRHGAVTIDT